MAFRNFSVHWINFHVAYNKVTVLKMYIYLLVPSSVFLSQQKTFDNPCDIFLLLYHMWAWYLLLCTYKKDTHFRLYYTLGCKKRRTVPEKVLLPGNLKWRTIYVSNLVFKTHSNKRTRELQQLWTDNKHIILLQWNIISLSGSIFSFHCRTSSISSSSYSVLLREYKEIPFSFPKFIFKSSVSSYVCIIYCVILFMHA